MKMGGTFVPMSRLVKAKPSDLKACLYEFGEYGFFVNDFYKKNTKIFVAHLCYDKGIFDQFTFKMKFQIKKKEKKYMKWE